MRQIKSLVYVGLFIILGQASCATKTSIENSRLALADESKIISVGRELYTKNCESCHSSLGNGKGESAMYLKDTVPSFQTKAFNQKSIEDISKIIANGVNGSSMESYSSEFNKEQIKYLAYYLKTLGQPKGSP
jgi:mono/diheme cytochrome c family protein